MIAKALPAESIWNWREVSGYFDHADNMFVEIFKAIETLTADKQWQLILYALVRLNKILEQIDDSNGCRFYIEGQLNQKLPVLFNQQIWPDDEKALWIFEHFKEYKYDVFPSLPEDFSLSPNVTTCFLRLCATEAEKRVEAGVDLSHWRSKWALTRLIAPLITHAKQNNDWLEQCRLMKMSAYQVDDYLKISQVCLDCLASMDKPKHKHALLDAENWLQQAYQRAKSTRETNQCQQFEVQLRLALGEYNMSWQLAWQLFTDQPSFFGYESLVTLQHKTGVIDNNFELKTEQLLADCYIETAHGITKDTDALLAFYLHHQALDKARVWALSHKANRVNLVTLADLIVTRYPQDAVDFYYRVVIPIIGQTNNNAYQQATDLLVNLSKGLPNQNADLLTSISH